MKVGFLINDLSSGGAEQATCGICGYLAENGIDTTIVTVNDCVAFYDVSDKVKVVSLSCNNIQKKSGIKRVFASAGKAFYIRKKIKSMNFDITVGMSNFMSYYLVIATLFTKTKTVGTERTDPYVSRNGLLHRFLKKATGKLSDGYVFQTKKQQTYYPSPKSGKTAIIPNAVFNKYCFLSSVPETRDKTVTSLGRLSKEKKYDDLIKAFSIFHKNHTDYTLSIFGSGDEKNNICFLINSLGIADSVIINEPRKDAILTVAKSSVYVLASGFEGFPNALLEAMYCGTPSISTDCSPAIDELIQNNENGVIVKIGDIKAISESLEKIVNDGDFSKKLSKNAVTSTQKYRIENIGKQWIDYFNLILS